MKERPFRIGELAEKTGLTIRTIRYYEEIDLLHPAKRSEAGYRLYGRNELERLQKIRSLKYLGLQLGEIKDCLKDRRLNLKQVIRQQMEQVRAEIELASELYRRLEAITNHLESNGNPTVDELLQIHKTMTIYDKYYTKEQLEYLEQRRKKIGDERIQEVQQEWKELIRLVREEMEKGTDPKSETMQQLVTRWEGLIREFTGGNPEIRKSLANMYSHENTEEVSNGYVDQEVMQFMGKAMGKADTE